MALPMISAWWTIGGTVGGAAVGVGTTLLVVSSSRKKVKDEWAELDRKKKEFEAERAAFNGTRQAAALPSATGAAPAAPFVFTAAHLKQVEESLQAKYRLQPKE